MNINGVECEFNLYNYDTAKRYEDSLRNLEKIKCTSKTLAGVIREQCDIARAFIDYNFGEGTSAEIFGDRLDLYEHTDVVGQIIAEANRQKEAYRALLAKYSGKSAK